MRKLFSIAVVALAVSAIACGKGNSESTAAPSSGPVSGTASISGTVVTASSGSSLPLAATPSSALVVSLIGTSMSATVDSTGHFTLANVPSGDLTLAFAGSGIDARLAIAGVGHHDRVRIEVHVHGNAAELEENEHEMEGNRIHLDGRVASKNCSANQITIGTTTPVVVNLAEARIRHNGNTLTCADIQVDDRVEIHGTRNGATIDATDVNVKTDHDVPPAQPVPSVPPVRNEVELNGTISLLAGACPSVAFTVSSTKVATNAATTFDDGACTALRNGDDVEVKGARQADGSVLATRVEQRDEDDDDDDDDEDEDDDEVKGTVSGAASGHACPAFTFSVGSTSVTTSANTRFEDTSCAGVVNGVRVEVKGTRTGSTIAASKVEKK